MSGLASERLITVLTALIEEYERQPEDRRHRIPHMMSMGGDGHRWGTSVRVMPSRDELDELIDAGLVDLDLGSRGSYLVKPTREGRAAIQSLRREEARNACAEPVDLSWAAVRPLLHAVVDAWAESGGSRMGYVKWEAVVERLGRSTSDLASLRAADLLDEGGWVEVQYEGDEDHPITRPTMRGVMATRAWPGGDGEVAAERLLTALDELVERTDDEERRGLFARLRDTAMEVGTKTLAEVVSKSVGTAV